MPFPPGHYSIWQQPCVPLAVRMDGPSEDLAAEAHPGRNHQASVRTAPRGAGHADTREASAGRHLSLSSGDQCETRVLISEQRTLCL